MLPVIRLQPSGSAACEASELSREASRQTDACGWPSRITAICFAAATFFNESASGRQGINRLRVYVAKAAATNRVEKTAQVTNGDLGEMEPGPAGAITWFLLCENLEGTHLIKLSRRISEGLLLQATNRSGPALQVTASFDSPFRLPARPGH